MAKKFKLSELIHPFKFIEPVEDDVSGDSWADVTNGTGYCKVETPSGFDLFSASQVQQEITHNITVWFPHTFVVDPAYRLVVALRFGAPSDSERTKTFRVVTVEEMDTGFNRAFTGTVIRLRCHDRKRDS